MGSVESGGGGKRTGPRKLNFPSVTASTEPNRNFVGPSAPEGDNTKEYPANSMSVGSCGGKIESLIADPLSARGGKLPSNDP